MIDSTKIDELIAASRGAAQYGYELLRYHVDNINSVTRKADGTVAVTTFDPIQFMIRLEEYVNACAELKLLELIASPTFYDALMRSAAEVEPYDRNGDV